jgi:protein SCO1/2
MIEKPPFRIIRRALLFLGAAGIVVLILLQNRDERATQSPVYGTVPDFSLTAEDGRNVSLNDLSGKFFVVDFIFTRCAGTCPIMSRQMQVLQGEFVNLPDIRLVSITVDPDYDTQEVLQRYAKQYGSTPHKWTFLTGEKSSIHQLAQKGFRLGISEEDGTAAEPIIHSTKFVLVDQQRRIRGYYDGTEEESVQQLIVDIKRLVKESP